MERIFFGSRHWRIGEGRRIGNLPSKNQRKRSILATKGRQIFIFPAADGTAKLSGRDHEFLGSALRQEQSAESENLSSEFQGEPRGFQSTESRDDAEAPKDFWVCAR